MKWNEMNLQLSLQILNFLERMRSKMISPLVSRNFLLLLVTFRLFTVHHSYHSSFIIHHPSFIIHHPSFIIHHASSIIHHASSIIHHASSVNGESQNPKQMKLILLLLYCLGFWDWDWDEIDGVYMRQWWIAGRSRVSWRFNQTNWVCGQLIQYSTTIQSRNIASYTSATHHGAEKLLGLEWLWYYEDQQSNHSKHMRMEWEGIVWSDQLP